MNIKKRFLACAIAVAVTGAGLPYYNKTISKDVKITASASTTVLSESQLEYQKFADYVQITEVKDYLYGNIEFPSTIEGLPVKVIGREGNIYGIAHSYNSKFKNIKIPNTVTTILEYTFVDCYNLESVEIPSSVVEIGDYAFANGSKLSSVDIPETGEDMTIGKAAFAGCTTLSSITIPDRVTDMGGGCLAGCTNLQYVTLSNTMTKLYDESRSDTSVLSSYGSKFGFFENCTSLKNIKFPDSIASIDERAFTGCTNLSKITIGANLTELGNLKLDLESLTEINVSNDNSSYSSDNGVLMNKNKTSLIRYPKANGNTEYAIPESVTSIESGAFSDCTNLTKVTVPEGVAKISSNTFKNCTRLKKIIIRNADCNIYSNPETIYKDAVIVGYKDSPVQEYADTYSRTFIDIEEELATATTTVSDIPAVETTTTTVSGNTYSSGDVNRDGFINASDSSCILAYYAYMSAGGTQSLEEYLELQSD
ncbi:MAG: leucine-rich repeat protein [Ruminococcus sp.]